MKEEKIKPVKLKFFATFIYGLIYWVFMLAAISMALMSLLAGEDLVKFLIVAGVFAVIGLFFKIIQGVRRKSLSKKINIIVDEELPYSSQEIKHYTGLKEDEDHLSESYYSMCMAYDRMSKSKLTFLITNSRDSGKRDGSVYITKAAVRLKRDNCNALFYKPKVPTFINSLGHIFYLYPHFVLHVGNKKRISAIPYLNFGMRYYEGSYTLSEDQKVPRDAEVIGRGYKYVNKDGSPDMRVANNPSAPKISTGELESEEYNFEYMFSNLQAVEDFFDKYIEFIRIATYTAETKNIAAGLAQELKDGVANKSITEDNAETVVEEIYAKGVAKVAPMVNSKQSLNPYEELEGLIGLNNVKQEIKTLANLVKVQQARKEEGLKNSTLSYHLVFTGNPGTGKTTIARIIASIYKDLKILKKGHLVETDRSGLVAEYLGQTAVKTNAVIDTALDGVLFIDEAYSLTDENDSYGKEAVATLLKRMEDDRDRLVVILAGYTENMTHFIMTNPGLESRFNKYIEFTDYNAEELFQIFMRLAHKYDYLVDEEAQQIIKDLINIEIESKDKQFGNARFVRNLFENILANQANRLANNNTLSSESLRTIVKEDCVNA
jgi:AAA+ superfamily predicted ATPase